MLLQDFNINSSTEKIEYEEEMAGYFNELFEHSVDSWLEECCKDFNNKVKTNEWRY